METRIYSIDSIKRNILKYPSSSNYTYNIMDEIVNSTTRIIPFNEKNVISIQILSIELPNTMYYINAERGNNTFIADNVQYIVPSGSYICQDLISKLNELVIILQFTLYAYNNKVEILSNDTNTYSLIFPTISTGYQSFGELLGFTNTNYNITPTGTMGDKIMIVAQDQYIFLRLNDLGNINNNNTNYVAKNILSTDTKYVNTNSISSFSYITNIINLEQPQDIKELKISLEDYKGNVINLNGANFSFTLQLTIITNTILKNYDQIKFYSEPVMQRLLQSKMLAYYEKEVSKEVNNSLTGTYNNNLINLNNIMEYTPFGNRNN